VGAREKAILAGCWLLEVRCQEVTSQVGMYSVLYGKAVGTCTRFDYDKVAAALNRTFFVFGDLD
jgi:hypothetical protein